jgi:hypothetical protein
VPIQHVHSRQSSARTHPDGPLFGFTLTELGFHILKDLTRWIPTEPGLFICFQEKCMQYSSVCTRSHVHICAHMWPSVAFEASTDPVDTSAQAAPHQATEQKESTDTAM